MPRTRRKPPILAAILAQEQKVQAPIQAPVQAPMKGAMALPQATAPKYTLNFCWWLQENYQTFVAGMQATGDQLDNWIESAYDFYCFSEEEKGE